MIYGVSSLNAPEAKRIELRYSVAKYVVQASIIVVLALGIVGSQVLGISHRYPWWLMDAAAVFLLAGGVYRGWELFDRIPLVVLDNNGVRDRRVAPVVIPWTSIKSVQPIAAMQVLGKDRRRIGVTLEFMCDIAIPGISGPQSKIFIDLARIDMRPVEFVDYVRQVAPRVAIDESQIDATVII